MTNERKSALPLTQLDRASRARIEHLLGVEPAAISEGDREFLRARQDYLSEEQRKDYGVEQNPRTAEEESSDKDDVMDAKQPKRGRPKKRESDYEN